MKSLFLLLVFILGPIRAQERITHPKVAKKRCFEKLHYRSCYELAHLYYKARDFDEAAHFATKGCEIEQRSDCDHDSSFKRMKEVMKKKKQWDKSVNDAIRANPNLIKIPKGVLKREKNCFSGKKIKDCGAVGAHFQFLQSPTDIKRAIKAYKHGCANGDEGSCSSLELIKKGIGKVYEVDM